MIRILPPDDPDAAAARRRAARRVRLDRVHQRQRRRGVHERACSRPAATCASLKGPRLCAVGPATAEQLATLRHQGRSRFPTSSGPRRVVERARDAQGPLDAVARAAAARRHRPRGHRRAAARRRARVVTDVVAYRTVLDDAQRDGGPDIYRMLLDGEIDVVTFTSASAVRNFAKVYGAEQAADLLKKTVVAAIGPVTAEAAGAARHHGRRCSPTTYTMPALVDAIAAHVAPRREDRARPLVVSAASTATSWQDRPARRHRLTLTRRPRRLAHRGHPRAGPRDAADARLLHLSAVRLRGRRRPPAIGSMPGVFQLSVDEAVKEAAAARADGVRGVMLFGLPEHKDAIGSQSSDPRRAGAGRRCARSSAAVPDLVVMTDVCLCEYTSHGHCGIVEGDEIVNDATVAQLVQAALSHAVAGADFVAPSDMMDGRVGAIRAGARRARLRPRRHHVVRGEVLLGVLRPVPRGRRLHAAVRRPPQPPDGSRPTSKRRCARCEIDIAEGADIVMVKPALPYLDVARAGEDALRPADGRLPRQRRVLDDQGGRRARLDRRDRA